MNIEKLTVKNFRNIESLELLPENGMNVICGENAQGKTNLLEAIWLFTGAKSFRGEKDSSFIRFGAEKADIFLDFISGGVRKDAGIEINERKTAELHGKKLQSAAALAGEFKAIIFSPSDLSLITAGPQIRRKFLDTAICQLYPGHINILRQYHRAVSQRNKLIKQYRYDSTVSVMLDVFEEEIAASGAKIIALRRKLLERIQSFLPSIYNGISSGREELSSRYVCCCEGENLKERLVQSRKEDMITCATSFGPHRDDIEFKINGISARGYGSQGQKRSVALSLKLAEAQVIKQVSGEYPVILLDDVMSELDPARQDYVLNHIKGWQSFLTCCDPSNVKNLKLGKCFEISGGRLK